MQSSAQADASQQTMKRPTMQSWLCHSDFEPVPRIERPLTSQLQVRMTTAVATPGVLARKNNFQISQYCSKMVPRNLELESLRRTLVVIQGTLRPTT